VSEGERNNSTTCAIACVALSFHRPHLLRMWVRAPRARTRAKVARETGGWQDGENKDEDEGGDGDGKGGERVTVTVTARTRWARGRGRGRQDKNDGTTAQHAILRTVLSCSRPEGGRGFVGDGDGDGDGGGRDRNQSKVGVGANARASLSHHGGKRVALWPATYH
jgi:hypothetical protein